MLHQIPIDQHTEMSKNGFTLIELMITIAVLAILLAVGMPSFQSVITSNRMTSQTNNFLAELALARSESIKRGIRVSICSSADITVATPSCANSPTWGTGWIIFTDSAGVAGTRDGTDTVLRVGDTPRGEITLVQAANTFVSYTASGAVTAQNTFTLCKSGLIGRTITISPTGRASPSNTAAVCS